MTRKQIYAKLLLTKEWKEKRLVILKRDNFTCVKCDITNVVLHVHHKIYFHNKNPWEYPDNYLETLCVKCHEEVHKTIKIKSISIDEKIKTPSKSKAEKIKNRLEKLESQLSLKDSKLNERYKNSQTIEKIETFGMHRTAKNINGGIDWVFNFTGNELQMLMVLLAIENPKNDLVEISILKKEHLLKSFNFSKQMFNRILASLENKEALIRITNSDIMLNPAYFYQGGTKNWKIKYENFLYCKDTKVKKKEALTKENNLK